jgi:hypothetical protein
MLDAIAALALPDHYQPWTCDRVSKHGARSDNGEQPFQKTAQRVATGQDPVFRKSYVLED